jgi:hypothetical protein
MVLCRVNVYGVSPEDLVTIKNYYFFALEKIEEHEGYITLNAMGGELCRGVNDFGEKCNECRYHPEVINKYLRKQDKFTFGEAR